MECKLPWIRYNEEFARFTECKKQRDLAQAGLAERKGEYETSVQPLRSVLDSRLTAAPLPQRPQPAALESILHQAKDL